MFVDLTKGFACGGGGGRRLVILEGVLTVTDLAIQVRSPAYVDGRRNDDSANWHCLEGSPDLLLNSQRGRTETSPAVCVGFRESPARLCFMDFLPKESKHRKCGDLPRSHATAHSAIHRVVYLSPQQLNLTTINPSST